MNSRGRGAAICAVLGLAFLAGCTGAVERENDPSPETSAASEGQCKTDTGVAQTGQGTISVAVDGDVLGFNGKVAAAASESNDQITDRLLSGFVYTGTDGAVCADEEFGSFELVSQDPFRTEYSLSEGAVWSDGVPVTYADYLLDWATRAITSQGEVATGSPGERPLFDHIDELTLGLRVPDGPEAESWDATTWTYEYRAVPADWRSDVGSALPAHVVADQAGVSTQDLATAIQERDLTVLRRAATFWNEGWLVDDHFPSSDLTPVNGPFMVAEDGLEQGGHVTLTANPNYWGTPPATQQITFRQVREADLIPALANGDIDVAEFDAPTAHTVAQLDYLGDVVTYVSRERLTAEHLAFNFGSGDFAGAESGLALREAFAHCVPRQEIVEEQVGPVDGVASLMNAREVYPFMDSYPDVVDAAYDGSYDDVDLDAARTKVGESGLEAPIDVRVAYPIPSESRREIIEAIKRSCDSVGFNVIDAGSETFYEDELPNGSFDVALFAWSSSDRRAAHADLYTTGGTFNYGQYSNDRVDAAWDTLTVSADPDEQTRQITRIEKTLWDTLYSLPLYAHPRVTVYRSDIGNVRDTATTDGAAWNAEQWSRLTEPTPRPS